MAGSSGNYLDDARIVNRRAACTGPDGNHVTQRKTLRAINLTRRSRCMVNHSHASAPVDGGGASGLPLIGYRF
jgi:hypothetical protein